MMGMGEPFQNYDRVLDGLRSMNDPDGLRARCAPDRDLDGRLGPRHRPAGGRADAGQARALAARAGRRAARPADARDERFPIAELMEACRRYRAATRRRVFVEYLLLEGVNDSRRTRARARQPAAAARPWRLSREPDRLQPDRGGLPAGRPPTSSSSSHGARAGRRRSSYRVSRGREIDAACGQLAMAGVPPRRRSAAKV